LKYRARYRALEEYQDEELRRASAEQKLEQLAALMASVDAMAWRKGLAEDDEVVWRRWQLLRHRFGKQ
jgi:hypothetical protein